MPQYEVLMAAQQAWVGGDAAAANGILQARLGEADIAAMEGAAQTRGGVVLPDLKWNLYATLMVQLGRLEEVARLIATQFGVPSVQIVIEPEMPGERAWFEVSRKGMKISIGTASFHPAYWLICLRLIEILPIMVFCGQNTLLNLNCTLSVSDIGFDQELSFCSDKPNAVLIPDIYFVSKDGYKSEKITFETNYMPWSQRSNKVFWRGSTTGERRPDWKYLPRIRLCEIANSDAKQRFDCFISHVVQEQYPEELEEIRSTGLLKNFISNSNLTGFKYHIDIDGNTSSWPGLFTKLLSGGVVLKVSSERGYRQWYYPRLEPWVHYVPVAADFSDLFEKVEWLYDHDEDAQRIGEAGRALAMGMTLEGEAQFALKAFEDAFADGRVGYNPTLTAPSTVPYDKDHPMTWTTAAKAEVIESVFKEFLGREPSSSVVVDLSKDPFSVSHILNVVLLSSEYQNNKKEGPFYYYNSMVDVEEIIRRHAAPDVRPEPGLLVNFLGVKIHPKYFPDHLTGMAGQVEAVPIPANWHADMAEWAAALRAVDLARDTFTVAELGCGWGCWINNTGVAARTAGLKVALVGVEGDEGHVQFAQECCAANGFAPDQLTIHRGIAAAKSGVALFPSAKSSGQNYALEPIFGADPQQLKAAQDSGDYDVLEMIPLGEVIGKHKKLDLLHIDIQGGELDLINNSLDVLRQGVAYMVIGTHSREIDGLLVDCLVRDGWRLEVERPSFITLTTDGPEVNTDGVQGWRNMRLLPD